MGGWVCVWGGGGGGGRADIARLLFPICPSQVHLSNHRRHVDTEAQGGLRGLQVGGGSAPAPATSARAAALVAVVGQRRHVRGSSRSRSSRRSSSSTYRLPLVLWKLRSRCHVLNAGAAGGGFAAGRLVGGGCRREQREQGSLFHGSIAGSLVSPFRPPARPPLPACLAPARAVPGDHRRRARGREPRGADTTTQGGSLTC